MSATHFHRSWNDLQVVISAAKIPASNAPTWTTYNFGIDGGLAFNVLGFEIDDYIDIYVQTTHAVALNTEIENHIHWTIPSNDAGKYIKFKIDVIVAAIGEDFTVPFDSPYTSVEYQLNGNEAGKHNLLELGLVAAFNSTVSSIAIIRLTRIAASMNDYSNPVYVLFNDCHVIQDTLGSIQENIK